MNDMQLFTFENQKVRTVTVDGEPYFAGKDVAIILGYGYILRKPSERTLTKKTKGGPFWTPPVESKEQQ